METVYTSRYRINLVFSLAISLAAAAAAGTVLPHLVKNGPLGPGNTSAVGAALVFLLLHLFLTRKYRKRKRIVSVPFPEEWQQILERDVVYYHNLNEEDKFIFQKKIQIFLGEKLITGVGTDADDRTRLLVAAAAVIPVFRIDDWEYDRLGEVLVYPENFNTDFETGGHEDVLGMVVHNTSSMIISKPALYQGFARQEGHNTAIHEFIHKIDEEDGDIDGLPALMMNRAELERWRETVRKESEKIEKGRSDINRYALTNEAEFFAVAGEYYFEKPAEMKVKHPELYEIMSRIFRQNLAEQIKREARGLVAGRRKKTGRNSPCPCGSGEKFKNCCMNAKKD